MAINVDYYLNRIRSTVTSVAAQVSNALPGNPVTRDYEILSQVGSAGPAFNWRIYAAQKRSTKKVIIPNDLYLRYRLINLIMLINLLFVALFMFVYFTTVYFINFIRTIETDCISI